MKLKWVITGIAGLVVLLSCEKYWEDHYDSRSETVNENVWDAIQKQTELSSFVQYIKAFSYDTLFLTNNSYTLFIPDNDAFNEFLDTGEVNLSILDYHISEHFIQSGSIQGIRKVQTLAEKFVVFEQTGGAPLYDNIPLDFESPLYLNGKYFTMSQVAWPRPNLYEFFATNNPLLKGYIDEQDSIVLDREKSRPIGYDSLGNTIYDTVSEVINIFELEYFPVSEEFRNKTATIVFPLKDDYEAALTVMADKLGPAFTDHNDIPVEWQYDILIPHLLEHGVFANQLEEYEFMFNPGKDSIKLKNIIGDSIVVTYSPVDKALCSNGYAYNYADFTVPDSLYIGINRFEGEWLAYTSGENKYDWYPEVSVIPDIWPPFKEYIPTASNDTILVVPFTKGFDGVWTLEFKTENMFPGSYHMLVRTHMDVGGIYEISVNDVPIMTIDYYTYVENRGMWWSCLPGTRYIAEGRFNSFDACDVEINSFGPATIRFDYIGPGEVDGNGLVIDYIEFTPSEE